jgi:diacylglycerol kinase (ATP)
MNLLLVYNTQAGHGKAGRLLDPTLARLAERGVRVDLRRTERPGHAVELVRGADLSAFDGVAAAGGDGTLYEVANGWFANPGGRKPPIGVIPVGTGNAFARDMDLATGQWAEAVDLIAAGKTRPVDAGRIRTGDRELHFLNIVGLGFVADVVKTAHALKWAGNVSYTIGVLHRTLALRPFRLKIEMDGRVLERDNLFVEISNTRWTSNFLMAPKAEVDDGLLDVTLLGPMTRRRLLKAFPLIFTGEHVNLPEVEQFQARSVRIEAGSPKVLTPDGELTGSTPATFDCLHRAVEVFWK